MKYFLMVLLGVVAFCRISAAEDVAGQWVATVDGVEIGVEEYVYTARRAIRDRFYHGKIPEAELVAYRRQLLEELIEAYLLAAEASRRGVQADAQAVTQALDKFKATASEDLIGSESGSQWLGRIEARVRRQSLSEQLQQQVAAVVSPDAAQVRGYYEANLDKFMRPVQDDVSVILIAVDPASGSPGWQQATDKATQLKAELDAGGSFEELAKIHSADLSASAGGAMGLLHRGLLGAAVETALAGLQPGMVAEPLEVLDGVVLFRLNTRVEAQQLPLEQVESRARGLLVQQMGELAWQALRFRLESQADIQLNESLLQKMGQ